MSLCPKAVTLVLAFVLLGCTSQPPPSASGRTPTGGTLRVVAVANGAEGAPGLAYYDPGVFFAYNPLVRCCLFRTMLSYNGRPIDEGGAELHPDLAEAMPVVSSDGLVWTFKLKGGLHYAPPLQGRVIEARDFITAIEHTIRVGDAPFYDDIVGVPAFREGKVGTIGGLEAPDARTLVVRLTAPAGDLGNRFSLGLSAPLPAEVLSGRTDADVAGFVVSSGPYMYERAPGLDLSNAAARPMWDGQAKGPTVLVRNPSWQRSSDSLRPAYVDRIEVTVVASEADAASTVEGGKADVMAAPTPVERARQYLDDPGRSALVHVQSSLDLNYVTMNLALPPFDDIHVRRAANLVLDRAAMASALSVKRRVLLRVAHHALPDALENNLLVDYNPYPTAGDHGSLDAAREEMRQSAYDANRDGRCDHAACASVSLGGTPVAGDPLSVLVDSMAKLGIHLVPGKGDIYNPRDHVAIGVARWGADYPNGANFGVLFNAAAGSEPVLNSSLIGSSEGQLAAWGYKVASVPSLEAWISSCVAAVGADGFLCWAEVDQLVMERVVAEIPVAVAENAWITSARVTAFSPDVDSIGPALDQIRVSAGG